MHKNIIDLKEERFGSLTVLGLTDLKTPKKRSAVWECKCDCGNICYKTSADLRDKRRKTVSCGCQNKGGRKFPNKFVSKTEVSIETAITKLSKKYGICKVNGKLKNFLWFIPLIILSCINMKNG